MLEKGVSITVASKPFDKHLQMENHYTYYLVQVIGKVWAGNFCSLAKGVAV